MRLWSKHTVLALAGKHETTGPLTWQLGSALVSALVLTLVGAEPAVAWKAEAGARKCFARLGEGRGRNGAEAGSYAARLSLPKSGAGRAFHIEMVVTKVVRHSRYVIFQSDYRVQYSNYW